MDTENPKYFEFDCSLLDGEYTFITLPRGFGKSEFLRKMRERENDDSQD